MLWVLAHPWSLLLLHFCQGLCPSLGFGLPQCLPPSPLPGPVLGEVLFLFIMGSSTV